MSDQPTKIKRVRGGTDFDEALREACDRLAEVAVGEWIEDVLDVHAIDISEAANYLRGSLSMELFEFHRTVRNASLNDLDELGRLGRQARSVQAKRESASRLATSAGGRFVVWFRATYPDGHPTSDTAAANEFIKSGQAAGGQDPASLTKALRRDRARTK